MPLNFDDQILDFGDTTRFDEASPSADPANHAEEPVQTHSDGNIDIGLSDSSPVEVHTEISDPHDSGVITLKLSFPLDDFYL